jgi:transposase InsO family protein
MVIRYLADGVAYQGREQLNDVRSILRKLVRRPITTEDQVLRHFPVHQSGSAKVQREIAACQELSCACIYLVAFMDWFSRKVLTWRLSNTMDADSRVTTLEEAIARFRKPEIFNTDQGSQFHQLCLHQYLEECRHSHFDASRQY